MEKPFVSIIVPVRNMERTLEKTFEYLLRINYPHNKWEIILADGGSTDRTVKIIKNKQKEFPFFKLIEIPHCPSPGFARNQALEKAQGDFFFFTDGDCAPCTEWITEILKIFAKDEKIGAVGGEIFTLRVDPNNLTEIYCESFGFNRVSWRYGNLQEGYLPEISDNNPSAIVGHRNYFFVTANVAYRRKATLESKAKFWSLPTGEDMDFCFQIKRGGWKFYFAPKAYVNHMHRADLKSLLKVWESYGRAHGPLLDEYANSNLEIVLQFLKSMPRYKIAFPYKGLIYIGYFHLMHFFAITALICFIFAISIKGMGMAEIFFLLSLTGLLYSKFKYYYWCFFMRPRRHLLTFCKMKYLTNWGFLLGGLSDVSKYKAFCIEPSF